MDAVTITVKNLTSVFTDEHAQAVASSLNAQALTRYNSTAWVTEGLAVPVKGVIFLAKGSTPDPETWHIELLDTSPEEGELGFHEDEAFDDKFEGSALRALTGQLERIVSVAPRKASNHSARGLRADAPEIPLSKIFCKTTLQDAEWPSEVASHEMLEMLVDPQVIRTPRTVVSEAEKRIYIVEVCDPVQGTGEMISGMLMSNFVLPKYFDLPQPNTGYDYRGTLTAPVPALMPDGYLSYAMQSSPNAWRQEFGSAA